MSDHDGVVDAEYEEQGKLRPIVGVVDVPVESIDGTSTVGATLKVRGRGDEFVVLELGDKDVRVRADQLMTALQSLGMLVPPTSFPHVHAPMPPFGGPLDGPPFPRTRRGRGHI